MKIGEIKQNKGYNAVHGHSRSSMSVGTHHQCRYQSKGRGSGDSSYQSYFCFRRR